MREARLAIYYNSQMIRTKSIPPNILLFSFAMLFYVWLYSLVLYNNAFCSKQKLRVKNVTYKSDRIVRPAQDNLLERLNLGSRQ